MQNLGQNAWYHIWSLNIHKSYRFCVLLGSVGVVSSCALHWLSCAEASAPCNRTSDVRPEKQAGQVWCREEMDTECGFVKGSPAKKTQMVCSTFWLCLKCCLPDKVYRWESLCSLLLIRWWWKHQSWCRTKIEVVVLHPGLTSSYPHYISLYPMIWPCLLLKAREL